MVRILFVDDTEGSLFVLSDILKRINYKVESASVRTNLYIKLHSFLPDLILINELGKSIDRKEVCKKIKSSLFFKSIPIILISGRRDLSKCCDECKADDVIAKTFDVDTLISKIKTQLNKRLRF